MILNKLTSRICESNLWPNFSLTIGGSKEYASFNQVSKRINFKMSNWEKF